MKHVVASDDVLFLRVKQQLCSLGASPYVLTRPEVSRLAKLLYKGEVVESYIYGSSSHGWGLLVGTNKRLLFVNKRIRRLHVNDVPYSMVNAVKHSFGLWVAKVTVRTGPKIYVFKRVNRKCAEQFTGFIQTKLLENQAKSNEQARAVEASKTLVKSMDYPSGSSRVERWVNG